MALPGPPCGNATAADASRHELRGSRVAGDVTGLAPIASIRSKV